MNPKSAVLGLKKLLKRYLIEKYLNWPDWDNESRRRAASALARILNFEFCIVFTTVVKSPFYVRLKTKFSMAKKMFVIYP